VIFKKSNNIEFISTVKGLESIEECLPRPAKNFIPQWFKDIPSSNGGSVKSCPSFPDYFSQGYIIPMWCDSVLQQYGHEWKWETSSNKFNWANHNNDQFIDYASSKFNGVSGQFIFKTNCPWKIKTPPGWSVLQLPLFYHFNQEWSVLPGVIDTDIHPEINQQVLYHGNGKPIKIKCGDPFVLYIPFKRSNKLNYKTRYQNNEDDRFFKEMELRIANYFRPNGKYRELQRKRDKKN
jgi:hypothetical protein